MPSYNKVILMGNLTKDPELRYIPSGTAVCNFDLAVNRSYKDKDGNKHDDVCFITLVAWGRTAETVSEYLKKGRPIFVEGYLQQRTWETPEGAKRSKHEVVVERFQFIGSKPQGENGSSSRERSDFEGAANDDVPF